MKKTDVVLGLQWGDEGKGKVVDVLTPGYKVIARFQGGPNAGHSLHFNGESYVLHTIPSGIFREGTINIIGNGVVIDPVILSQEIAELEAGGANLTDNLKISKKAHLILPTHRILDAASEAAKGKAKIGSTLKGIGPAYMNKTGRNGLRVGDIVSGEFTPRYNRLKEKHLGMLAQYDFPFDIKQYEKHLFDVIEKLRRFEIIDRDHIVNRYIDENVPVLAEGAQGALLDVDFGTYPFVTSSNTLSAGACTGLGIAPNRLGEVFGIFKAYCTRVGSGPFPTELFDADGERLRKVGREFGATTGRPRRCGWLDLVALKYTVMLNGVTSLIMMKSDVMTGMEKIKVAVAYNTPHGSTASFPYEVDENTQPVYIEMEGWNEDISKIRKYDQLPEAFRNYVEFIESQCGVPIGIISVGPDRDETIMR
ncbi:MAG: adenylosuccinate synthase [Alistipes sp.]|nr:adenylosuccinate synthase [Alistipes sp.]